MCAQKRISNDRLKPVMTTGLVNMHIDRSIANLACSSAYCFWLVHACMYPSVILSIMLTLSVKNLIIFKSYKFCKKKSTVVEVDRVRVGGTVYVTKVLQQTILSLL